jgi:hypothetical protein
MSIAITVENLSKCYEIYDKPRDRLKQFFVPRLQRMTGQTPRQYYREFWALKDVSFEIKKGETVGIHWPQWQRQIHAVANDLRYIFTNQSCVGNEFLPTIYITLYP